MDATLWELLKEGATDDLVEVLIRLVSPDGLPGSPVQLVARMGNIVSCRIRRGDILTVRQHKTIASMKGPKRFSVEPYPEEVSTPYNY